MPSNPQFAIDITNRRLISGITAFTRGDKFDVDLYFFESTAGIFATTGKSVIFSSPTITFGVGPMGKPVGGTFKLVDGAQSTAAISYNATAAAVQSAIRAALTTNWSAAIVTGGDGGRWTIDRGVTGSASALTSSANNLLPASSIVIDTIFAGSGTVNAVQEVQLNRSAVLNVTSWSLTSDGLGYTGTLDFTGPSIDEVLAGATSISAVLEINVSVSTKPVTYVQTNCTLLLDLT